MSKGDTPRPVDPKKWSDNYDYIFRKKISKQQKKVKKPKK